MNEEEYEKVAEEQEMKKAQEAQVDEQVHEDIEDEAAHEGSQELYPGGPTYDQIQGWKSLYENEVYMSEFGDDTIIFRPIRRREYREIYDIEGSANNYYIEEQVCRKSILWPEDYADQRMAFGKAGIPTTLSQIILERSGFLRPAVHQL